MPYLFDLLGGYPGFRPTDNRTEYGIPGRSEVGALGSTGSARGKPKPDWLTDDAGAYGGRSAYGNPRDLLSPASPMRMLEAREHGPEEQQRRNASSSMAGQPLVTPGAGVPPPMSRPPLTSFGGGGNPAGTFPGRAPQGQAPPMNPQGAGPTVPQQAPAPQGVSGPAGATPPERPNFLGRARDWLGGEAFPAGQGMSRGMVLAQALGNFGAGLSQTGRVGAGLQMANQGMWDAREGERKFRDAEEERQYRRLEMAYKQKKLEQEVAPQSHVLSAGGMLVGPNGEVLAQAPTAQKAPTTLDQALLSDNPEIRARAEEVRDAAARIEGTPTAFQQEEHALKLAKLKAEIAKASRPAGTGTPRAPPDIQQLIEYRNSLPPGSEEWKLADQYLRRKAASGGSGGAVAPAPPEGYVEAPQALRTKAGEAMGDAQAVYKKAEALEKFEGLDDLMTTGSGWWGTAEEVQKRTGVPLTSAQTAHLSKTKALAALIGEMSSAIRGERFGMSLTSQEKASAESYLPTEDDSVITLRAKLKGIKTLARSVMQRQRDVLEKGINLEVPPEEAEEAPPPADTTTPPASAATPPPAAALERVGQPATDQERATLPIARSKADAKSMPKGELFIMPSGRLGMNF